MIDELPTGVAIVARIKDASNDQSKADLGLMEHKSAR